MIHSTNGFQLNQLHMLPSNTLPCFDNYIGKIVYNGQQFVNYQGKIGDFGLQKNQGSKPTVSPQIRTKVNYTNQQGICENRTPKIVILLESPHIHEFNPVSPINKAINSGPALGSTGDRFNSQCIKVFNQNIKAIKGVMSLPSSRTEYEVYFVNAIQYQCSLGQPNFNRGMRDFIFQALWNKTPDSFKDDLIERLNILQPDLIINACTKELRESCCNGNSIVPYLTYNNIAFLTASHHVSAWNKNTILL